MPYSSPSFDKAIAGLLQRIMPSTALDIGAGAGKYGRMLKETCPDCAITGIEIQGDYITQFRLTEFYERVECIDALELMETAVDSSYDVVIFGDVLEHFAKSRGVDLLHFFVYRSRYVLAIYPTEYVQNTVGGNRSEAHVSIWGEADFTLMDHSPILSIAPSHMVLIRGYLEPPGSLSKHARFLEETIRLGADQNFGESKS